MMKHILINLFIGLIFVVGFSQQSIVGAGGEAKSSDGSFSYSVGQLVVSQVLPGSNLWGSEAIALNHGVQQVYLANCANANQIRIVASPNPSKGLVNIDLFNWDEQDIILEMYDLLGKVVLVKILNEGQTQLNLSHMSSGIYIFSISNNCDSSSKFKLILNN